VRRNRPEIDDTGMSPRWLVDEIGHPGQVYWAAWLAVRSPAAAAQEMTKR
jgi:hypothetical protein